MSLDEYKKRIFRSIIEKLQENDMSPLGLYLSKLDPRDMADLLYLGIQENHMQINSKYYNKNKG